MKSKKLLALINSKKEEARGLLDTDMAKAKAIVEEVRGLEEDLKTVEALEEDELRNLANKGVNIRDEKREYTKEDELRAIGKYITGSILTEEERALVTVSDNGALLPEGYINELMLLRKGFPALKDYCHVIPVKTKTGKMPVATLGNNKLAKLSSNQPIPEGAMITNDIIFDIEDYGKFVPIENSLTDDEVVGIISNILIPDFAEGSVAAENEEIMTLVKANTVRVEGDDYTAIEDAIDTSLPSVKGGLITVTNTAGYAYLKNRKDTIGRNLNLVTVVNGITMFQEKPLVVIEDENIEVVAGKLVFYVANLKEVCKFLDRQTFEVTKSTEFLFNKNQNCLRAIERFDTELGSKRSCKTIVISKTPTPAAFSVEEKIEDTKTSKKDTK